MEQRQSQVPEAASAGPALVRRLHQALVRHDPNLGRLALASKTVGAVVIALLLLRHQPITVRLLGATCTAFLMQCVGATVSGGSQRYPHWSLLASGVAMAVLITLATGLHEIPILQEALLVGIAFAVFAVRRRLPDHGTFPLFLFTTTVLSASIADRTMIVPSLMGCLPLLSLVIAYPLLFLIRPRLDGQCPAAQVSSRTPYRAALAAMLAIVVQHLIDLPRAYWSVLVAVVITAETHQQLLSKAGERLIMTIIGCLLALLLHFAAQGSFALQLSVLMVGIFGATYFRTASYRLMVGFLSVYVVFLFAIIGQWDIDIVAIRIYETAIGCTIALVVPLMLPYDDAPPAPRDPPESGPGSGKTG
jgi:hypothetical protein